MCVLLHLCYTYYMYSVVTRQQNKSCLVMNYCSNFVQLVAHNLQQCKFQHTRTVYTEQLLLRNLLMQLPCMLAFIRLCSTCILYFVRSFHYALFAVLFQLVYKIRTIIHHKATFVLLPCDYRVHIISITQVQQYTHTTCKLNMIKICL